MTYQYTTNQKDIKFVDNKNLLFAPKLKPLRTKAFPFHQPYPDVRTNTIEDDKNLCETVHKLLQINTVASKVLKGHSHIMLHLSLWHAKSLILDKAISIEIQESLVFY